jgi:hypothetical protein
MRLDPVTNVTVKYIQLSFCENNLIFFNKELEAVKKLHAMCKYIYA